MKANASPMSVADFCGDLVEGHITVNHDYQREENVWNSYMKSYFIESILLGYPIPKIFLYVNYDLKTKKSKKEIVDGQQRSAALRQFFENKLRISSRIDSKPFQGKLYKNLEEVDQQTFLSYSLPVDEFSGVTEEDVREAFTRMNANNVALNAEELRNAKYKGLFKWFVNRVAKSFREPLLTLRLISRRDIIRMSDLRMFAEYFYILDSGIETTKSGQIDDLYRRYDVEFADEPTFTKHCSSSIKHWLDSGYGDYERLCRKHVFYTHIAAITESLTPGTISAKLNDKQLAYIKSVAAKGISLDQLDAALIEEQNEIDNHPLKEFIEACTAKTNVGHEKLVRYAYLLGAM